MMEFNKMEKVHEGKFITRYDIEYTMKNGKTKVYEMISRNKNMKEQEDLDNLQPDAVVVIVTDESGERILVNREFRMAMGRWVYNFPAGLIDPGEDEFQAAKRELFEETGMDLLSIDDVIPVSYSAPGFSNEKNVCIVGKAGGTFKPSTSAEEEIEAGWYTKAQMRELLSKEPFAARTQAYCYVWSRE